MDIMWDTVSAKAEPINDTDRCALNALKLRPRHLPMRIGLLPYTDIGM